MLFSYQIPFENCPPFEGFPTFSSISTGQNLVLPLSQPPLLLKHRNMTQASPFRYTHVSLWFRREWSGNDSGKGEPHDAGLSEAVDMEFPVIRAMPGIMLRTAVPLLEASATPLPWGNLTVLVDIFPHYELPNLLLFPFWRFCLS